MTSPFNESLYNASLQALTDNGVPSELAEKASQVIASDDPTKSDLGRSDCDREIINQTMNHYWQHQKEDK
ncbi:MAG: hypothetical protein HC836_42480 [Richelia sp. RM2_1_2]|nr:hypothetical protein [Richelia sp. SM2_1_7]NJM21760.1 hypothetical protein [Richelia sp. SM1_7_0]NJN12344.1 hypothetical protein [Richelia sp. RM1_1_1]NJO30692.1 hypothetical protein [Richelia sp. SL_2_1]NJO64576.1 hypothetical protein [Richelia sp. RM2_1_2]